LSCSTGYVQWTNNARNYLKNEIEKDNQEFKKQIEQQAVITLRFLNDKRVFYGLKPINRINKAVVKETINNIVLDSVVGDAGDVEQKFFYEDEVLRGYS